MSDYLPLDILIDILTRLPAESLVRLTSVCKSWHSLITSPKFISHHLHRTMSNPNNNDCLLVRHRTAEEPKRDHYTLALDGNDSFRKLKTLDLPVDDPRESLGYSVVGSCNGVICLSNDQDYGYLNEMSLWNPSIRKFFAIPTYNVTFESHGPFMHCVGFGFDLVTNDFKVVRIVHTGEDYFRSPPLVEIYTLKTGRWRYISDEALSSLMIKEGCRQAYLNGAAHWLAFAPATPLTQIRNTILSFNMSDEVFKEILVPDSSTDLIERMRLLVFKESLCLIQQGEYGHCSVWIMKEYGIAASWAYLFRINLWGDLRWPLGLRKNGEVIFSTDDGNLVSCDHQSSHITYLGIKGKFGNGYSHTFYPDAYVESLELLNKLESPEDTEVSGQKKKKKKKKKKKGQGEGEGEAKCSR